VPNLSVNISGYSSITADSIVASGNIEAQGQFLAKDGTQGSPGYAFKANTNYGLFNEPVGSRIAITAAGAEKAYWGPVNHNYTTLQAAVLANLKSNLVQDTAAQVAFKPAATQSFTAVGNAFASTARFVLFDSNGNYTLTSTPTLPNGTYDGQICTLLNIDSGADIITVQDQGTLANSNLRLGAVSRAIGPRDSLTLVWISSLADWVELGYNTVV
jgi:hypothetical protein